MVKFLKKQCCEHPYRFVISFFVLFIGWFVLLEKADLPVVWNIHCSLDKYIPFVKYAVIPYSIWFLWMTQSMFHEVIREDGETRWRMLAPLFGGLLLILLFCTLVPNGISIRPAEIPGNDLCARAARFIESTDNPTCVCPSMHVSSTIAIDIVVRQCRYIRPRVKNLETIIAALICIATLFIRQHSIIDVALGFAMSWALYVVWTWAIEPKISGSQAL